MERAVGHSLANAALLALTFGASVQAHEFLRFGFAGAPSRVEGSPGERVRFETVGVISEVEDLHGFGIQGWSLGLSSVGCQIVGVTTAGTDGATVPEGWRQPDGFERVELSSSSPGAGACEGAACVVLLAADGGAELPRARTSSLVRLTVEAVVPTDAEACAAARLFLKDECLDSIMSSFTAALRPAAATRPTVMATGERPPETLFSRSSTSFRPDVRPQFPIRTAERAQGRRRRAAPRCPPSAGSACAPSRPRQPIAIGLPRRPSSRRPRCGTA
jgi:hypothetical protein